MRQACRRRLFALTGFSKSPGTIRTERAGNWRGFRLWFADIVAINDGAIVCIVHLGFAPPTGLANYWG